MKRANFAPENVKKKKKEKKPLLLTFECLSPQKNFRKIKGTVSEIFVFLDGPKIISFLKNSSFLHTF